MAMSHFLMFLFLTCLHLIRGAFCEEVIISTGVGEIVGIVNSITQARTTYNVSIFWGIPYAESTFGNRRFAKPVKRAPFSSPFNATISDVYSCPMNVNSRPGLDQIHVDEDCLGLNIFVPGKPQNVQQMPVMIWIYGGAFQWGTQDLYQSPGFSASNDVILVTFNYRMSAYGFLANKQYGLLGNYGLWDQHMAIRWVHDNIASFGGDPNRVTLFGESAGSASVFYQALYKGNEGLFIGIIAQSGSPTAPWGLDDMPHEVFSKFIENASCSHTGSSTEMIKCLQEMELKTVERLIGNNLFLPVVDGEFVTVSPEDMFNSQSAEITSILNRLGDLNVILGINSNDGALLIELLSNMYSQNVSEGLTYAQFETLLPGALGMAKYNTSDVLLTKAVLNQYYDWMDPTNKSSAGQKLVDVLTDTQFAVSILDFANAHARSSGNGNIYFYQFDHRPSFSAMHTWIKGANHADEIPFVLGFPSALMFYLRVYGTDPSALLPPEEVELSKSIMLHWTQFARSGNPNKQDVQAWEPYTTDTKKYIVFETKVTSFKMKNHIAADAYHFWTDFVPPLQKSSQKSCDSVVISDGSSNMISRTLCLILGLLSVFKSWATAE